MRWLRDAIRSRVLVNLLLIAVAALAVMAAVLGPLLVRAMVQSTVRQSVEQAGADGTAIEVSIDFNGDGPEAFLQAGRDVLSAAAADGRGPLWTAPQVWSESTQNVAWSRAGAQTTTELASRVRLAGTDCQGMVFVAGRCPTAVGEAVVASTDATKAGAELGSHLTLRPPSTTTGARTPPSEVTVVGTYDRTNSGVPRTAPGQSGDASVTGAPIVVTVRQSAALSLPIQILGRTDLRTALGAQDEAAARDSIAAVKAALLLQSRTIDVSTGLTDVLDRVDAQVRDATILVAVTEIQALALAVFALAVVLQRIAVARAAEWGIGRLRGVPKARWYVSIYAEPAIALAVGCLLGFLAGQVAAAVAVRAAFGPQTPVEPWRWPVVLAGAAVLLAFLAALVAVSAPSLRRPLVELIQTRSESRTLTVTGAVAQSAVVLLAGASVYQLRSGTVLSSAGSQLGLLAPALLALALAIAAVRLAVLLVRRVTAKPPRTLVGLIVGRQAARTPSSLNPAVVVAVGMALAVFATQVAVVSVRNQSLRASTIVGAPTVLEVDVPGGADLRTLVDTAEPTGHYAMAVQERNSSGDTGVNRILAVDTTRFAAISDPATSAVTTAELAALRPATGEPVTIKGSRVEARLTGVSVQPGVVDVAGEKPADPHLVLVVQAADGWHDVDLGSISQRSPLAATLPCTAGCRLVALGTRSAAGAAYTAQLTLARLQTDQQSAADWQPRLAGSWVSRVGDQLTASPRNRAVPKPGATGLQLAALDEDGGNPALALPGDAADPLPALVAPDTAEQPFAGIPDAALGRSLDGQSQLLVVVGRPAVLPRLLDEGVLVDLDLAGKLADPAQGARTNEVWLAADAPAGVEQALTGQGLKITDRQLLSTEAQALTEQPSTRAAVSSRYLGLAALALAMVALIAALAADVSRRRPDWASLMDGGLSPRTVFRLAYVEIGLPVVLGALLGVVSGVAGYTLAASKLPVVDLTAPGPPLDLHVDQTSVLQLLVVVVVVVLVIAAVAARLEIRRQKGHH